MTQNKKLPMRRSSHEWNGLKRRELSKRSKKPHTYRRIVTANANGKAVVRSDEPLPAYEFKTVPGCEHTLIWGQPGDLRPSRGAKV
jgi:hypothetical protein